MVLNIAINVLREERVKSIDRLAHLKEMSKIEPSWTESDEIHFLNNKIEQLAEALKILEKGE